MSKFKLSKRSKANREGVDPRLIQISDLAITITRVDFGHGQYAGLREPEEQHALFLEGKSKCDGYEKESFHQSGKALDFYAYVDGAASWKREHLTEVAAAFLQAASLLGYRLQWGGFWPWDAPHVELVD